MTPKPQFNPEAMLQQAMEMRTRIAQQLGELRVEASSGGGMVRVVVDGTWRVISVTLDPQVVNANDIGLLQDLIVAALNEARSRAAEQGQETISKVTGEATGMDLGALADAFS